MGNNCNQFDSEKNNQHVMIDQLVACLLTFARDMDFR
jgi:hypothetical protein